MKYGLNKIISGGQTGVDLAALMAAEESGYQVGGWCPPDGRNEAGPIPVKYKLKPTPRERSRLAPEVPRSMRTEWNIRDSDGTLLITLTGHQLKGGSLWTLKAAEILSKPCLQVSLPATEDVQSIRAWLLEHQVAILNIAGPSESEIEGIHQMAYLFLMQLFASCRKALKSYFY